MEPLATCEDYARQNPAAADGELFESAMIAGIHLSLETGDESGALARIVDLEKCVRTSGHAPRVGGALINVANQASHRQTHGVAVAAAESAVRVGQRCNDDSTFLVGALYTEAMVIGKTGDHERALAKAEAIVSLCNDPKDAMIRMAANQLIAGLRRTSGDSETAVDLARAAVKAATGRPEDIAFIKAGLARALNDNGQTEEALKQAKESWLLAEQAGIPDHARVDFLSQIAHYASQLGEDETVASAVADLERIPDESNEVKKDKAHAIQRAAAHQVLRERFVEVMRESDPEKAAGTAGCQSLSEANALVVRPLMRLWDEMPEAASGCYDFWGRGNFERLLLNARRFPQSFNVTVEVRSLDDVKRAVRLWGLYADFLVLLWKGPTNHGLAIVPFPADYEAPGGWGYVVCAGDVIERPGSTTKWHPAIAHMSMFPDDVTMFLATEARQFVQSGRLIVVPAVAAGCINPGHGPFEQLLAEAANAIPSIRWKGFKGSPIGYIPHSPNAPFELLAELAETESPRLRKLRLLLLRRSRELRPAGEVGGEAKMLSLEIDDALRELQDRSDSVARTNGLDRAREPLVGGISRFRSTGKKLAGLATDSPFAPLLVLQNLGYGWRVDGPEVLRLPPRFEPQEGDVVGTWLAPPSPGWTIQTARR